MKYSRRVMDACVALWLAAGCAGYASAQELQTKFSCSVTREEDGERVIYADNGEFRLKGDRIEMFRWESTLHRTTHGFDCSIDDGDGLQAEVYTETALPKWRIGLVDAKQARQKRGFDFSRGLTCAIRLERQGDTLSVKPDCPAMCGSRSNFSGLVVDLKTGKCRYEE